jgi:hypothetical protein
MSNMNTLGQTTLQIENTKQNPNTKGYELLVNSNVNFLTPKNTDLSQPVDPNIITTSTHKTYHMHNANSYQCQYPNDPAQQGILNSSSLYLAQQQEPNELKGDPLAGNLYTQRMVSYLAYNPILQQQP